MVQTTQSAKRPADTEDATPPAPPVYTVRYGNVSAAVFAKQAKTKDGKSFETFQVSLRRSYRVEGDWKQTPTLTGGDLLPAALALQKCYEFIQGDDER